MSDEIDLASQVEEEFRQYLISRQKYEKKNNNKIFPKNGKCYNCGDYTKESFCGIDCREDWEKRKYFEKQKKI